MKRFFFYFFLGLMAFLATSGMFILKYHVVGKEKNLARIHNQIVQNNRSIHILQAEWANLSDAKRLRILVEKNTTLQKIKPTQVIHWEDIAFQEKQEGS